MCAREGGIVVGVPMKCLPRSATSSNGNVSDTSGTDTTSLLNKSTEGALRGAMSGNLNLAGAGVAGIALGMALSPEGKAALERQALVTEQRQAQAAQADQAQMEQSKQRILGALKGYDSTSDLKIKTSDSDLTVTQRSGGAFGGSSIIALNGNGLPPAKGVLQIKLGDVVEKSSAQSGLGLDTAGKIMGGNLPPPPPSPTSSPLVGKAIKLDALKSVLRKNETEEKSLNNQLALLEQASTPDPVAIRQVQEKIVIKQTEKKKVEKEMQNLTAEDDDDVKSTSPQPQRSSPENRR